MLYGTYAFSLIRGFTKAIVAIHMCRQSLRACMYLIRREKKNLSGTVNNLYWRKVFNKVGN